MGTRSGAQRDAITVEIGYALVSGGFVAVLVYLGLYAPIGYFDLPRGFARVAGGLAALTFVVRVVHVLWRFPRGAAQGTELGRSVNDRLSGTPGPDQPSQPGRTSPDS
ncbi:DUF6332 family protein [Streptomyces liangshanensis]|uniref:Uncharacterized protein n=1 Tax=Streptomyces liangshanensis TaxID=2717324 RepID=A0A6G9H6X0_9ACTN|nr:DUF6332 family protein [Streptomyces liangshanensis]QIQ06240.1 hypothetical protein HA039_31505 [Streptomyces liangshanensis]